MHFDGDGNLFRLGRRLGATQRVAGFAGVAVGSRVVYGEAESAGCLDEIRRHKQNWTDIPPKRLCQKLAEGRGFDN